MYTTKHGGKQTHSNTLWKALGEISISKTTPKSIENQWMAGERALEYWTEKRAAGVSWAM